MCILHTLGFTLVLCVGNYYRAVKAMERQRQRRLARLAGNNIDSNTMMMMADPSPRSSAADSTGSEEAPLLASFRSNYQFATRRRPEKESSIFQEKSEAVQLMSV